MIQTLNNLFNKISIKIGLTEETFISDDEYYSKKLDPSKLFSDLKSYYNGKRLYNIFFFIISLNVFLLSKEIWFGEFSLVFLFAVILAQLPAVALFFLLTQIIFYETIILTDKTIFQKKLFIEEHFSWQQISDITFKHGSFYKNGKDAGIIRLTNIKGRTIAINSFYNDFSTIVEFVEHKLWIEKKLSFRKAFQRSCRIFAIPNREGIIETIVSLIYFSIHLAVSFKVYLFLKKLFDI